MAPMAYEIDRPRKRSSSAIDLDIPIAKRSLVPLRHRKISWDFNVKNSFHDSHAVEILLTRSVSLALDVVGFDASEPLALESFRKAAEQCMRLHEPWLYSLLTDHIRYAQFSRRRSTDYALLS